MALGVQNYNGGTTDEYGTLLSIDRQMGSGVVEGLLVVANATPNMTVYVQPGSGLIPTGTYPSSYNYRFHIDTALPGASVAVGTAAASPRIDYIVVYVDKSVAGSTAGANVNNTNAVLKLADVQGTPAGSPSVPTVSQIQSTIGASNPYIILAQIAVGSNVTTITNSNITDLRTFASDRNDAALGAASYVDNGGILTFTASTLNGNITAGLVYLNVGGVMVPQSFNALSYSVSANQDTYFYVQLGNSTVQKTAVANNASSPGLPTNSVWLGIAVSGASAITSLNAGQIGAVAPTVSGRTLNVSDSNGQLIYPTANQKLLAYAQITANFATSSGPVQITGLSVAVIVPTGRRAKVAFQPYKIGNSASPSNVTVSIWDGAVGSGTQIQAQQFTVAGSSYGSPFNVAAYVSPSTSSKTYNAGLTCVGGSTSTLEASATYPAFISVELV